MGLLEIKDGLWVDRFLEIFKDNIKKHPDEYGEIYSAYKEYVFRESNGEQYIDHDIDLWTCMFLAELTIRFPEDFESVYSLITPEEFYNLTYWHATCSRMLHPTSIRIEELYIDFVGGISLQSLIDDNDDTSYRTDEYTFYENLKLLSKRESSKIIEAINTGASIRSNLKQKLANDDVDGFVDILICNGIDYDLPSSTANVWTVLQKTISIYIKENSTPDETTTEDNLFMIQGNENASIYLDLYHYADNDTGNFLEINWPAIYDEHFRRLAGIIFASHALKTLTSYIDIFYELQEIISSHPWLKGIEDFVLKHDDEFMIFWEPYTIDLMEEFKNRFVIHEDLHLLDNVITPIDTPSPPCNRTDDMWYSKNPMRSTADMTIVYRLLVEQGWLDDDDATLSNFLYRTATDYSGSNAEPARMLWKGSVKDLKCLVKTLFNKTNNKWRRTEEFFECLVGGYTPKDNHETDNLSAEFRAVANKFPHFIK